MTRRYESPGSKRATEDSYTLMRIFVAMIFVLVGCGLFYPTPAQEEQKLDLYLETGHSFGSAAFSSDGKTIASWGSYGTLKLWDVRSGRELDTIKGADHAVFSPDGKTVALLGLKDNIITLWDIVSWRKLHTFSWNGGTSTLMQFSKGNTLASWSNTKLTLWDTISGNELSSLQRQAEGSWNLFFSPDLSTIAWLGDRKITLLDATSGHELQNLSTDSNYGSLIFSPGGNSIAAWNDKTVTFWNAATGDHIHTVQIGTRSGTFPNAFVFSPSGSLIAFHNGNSLRLWSVASGQELGGLSGFGISNVTFSPDERTIALNYGVLYDTSVALWEVGSPQPPRIVKEHVAFFASFRFSPDGKTLAIGAAALNLYPGSVKLTTATLWDVASRGELPTLNEPSILLICEDGKRSLSWVDGGKTIKLLDSASWRETGTLTSTLGVTDAGYSRDGKIILSWNNDGIVFWDSATGERRGVMEGSPGSNPRLVFSPDAKLLATVSDKTRLWDLTAGRQLHALKGDGFAVDSFTLSPNGKTLATWIGRTKVLKLWDLESGQLLRTLGLRDNVREQHHAPSSNASMLLPIKSFAVFSPNGNMIAAWTPDEQTVIVWDVNSGKRLHLLHGPEGISSSVVFSKDESRIAFASGRIIRVWETAASARLRSLDGFEGGELVFSSGGKQIASAGPDFTVRVWDIASGEFYDFRGHRAAINDIDFALDGKTIASVSSDNTIKLWDASSKRLRLTLTGHGNSVSSIAFSADGRLIALSSSYGSTQLWETSSGKLLKNLESNDPRTLDEVYSLVPILFTKNKLAPILVSGRLRVDFGENGWINLSDSRSGALAISLIAIGEDEWAVVTPDGRFDTNKSLDQIEGLHWVINNEILNPLPLDVFMRQYYEPGLMRRVMNGEQLKSLPSIADINRVQPKVTIEEIRSAATAADLVDVKIAVKDITEDVSVSAIDTTKKKQFSSGVYDLRLFRNGQLVGYSTSDEKLQTIFRPYQDFDDELTAWRAANKVDLVDSEKTFTFSVRLPKNSTAKEVEFSAYAFNEDRVKSDTARLRWSAAETTQSSLPTTPPVKPRAYVISVGVNANENPAFNLQFAANDARRFQEVLPQRLTATGEYSEVVPITLVSDWELRGGRQVTTRRDATKGNFKAVLDLLAGQQVADEIRNAIPNSEKLRQSTPDDLVLILFSSHGYADRSGVFYFIPYDTGPGACNVFTETVRQRSISSDELSLWLRDVDAGQMTLIVDACYSTAAIEGSGFKPGPMGSRGLGQLAYDKRMRILTATQADNVAMELPATADGKPIMHGLLTYALLENGLGENQADFKPHDKTIYLDEWLEFGVKNTPKLSASQPHPDSLPKSKRRKDRPRFVLLKRGLADLGACEQRPAGPARIQEQLPSLFDFTRRKREVALARNP